MYKEGLVEIKYQENAFLNSKSRLTRDIGVAFIDSVFSKEEKKELIVLDPTAATGIRGIRYVVESEIKNITFLEINKSAYNTLKKNLRYEKINVKNKINATVLNKSIQEFANTTKERYNIIDLDPFGSISPNLYDILKITKDNSYLFMTATDTAVLCGAEEKACLKIYGAKPMHNELCHEVGLRILIGYVAKIAAQFNINIKVIFAFSYAHYFRVLVKLSHGAEKVNESIMNDLGYVYYCNKCGYRNISKGFLPNQNTCKCNAPLLISGRLWINILNNKDILQLIYNRLTKIKDINKKDLKFVEILINEPEIPLYYSLPKLTKRLKTPSIKMANILDNLKSKGFIAERTHFDLNAIKTNAPIDDIKNLIYFINRTSTIIKKGKI
ncbi:MAG: hypothetical protein M1538_01420 [Candidatus Marsarchaeota archaeon]|jgi:tRNA (guanine26-N2/guanine27-N2)-dimethyltransferase|nr:hypothetical protein [Candidatus Marsarchaeota archaeon]